jgi:hypothetical protein
MKLYELLSICNNSENTIIVKKEKEKEILLKIDTEIDKIIKIFGVDTLKEFEYVRQFEVVSFYINQSNSILYVFVK